MPPRGVEIREVIGALVTPTGFALGVVGSPPPFRIGELILMGDGATGPTGDGRVKMAVLPLLGTLPDEIAPSCARLCVLPIGFALGLPNPAAIIPPEFAR